MSLSERFARLFQRSTLGRSLSSGRLPDREVLTDKDRLLLQFVHTAQTFPNGIAFNFADPQYYEHTQQQGLRSKDFREKQLQMWVLDPKRDKRIQSMMQNGEIDALRSMLIETFGSGIGLRGGYVRVFAPPRVLFPMLTGGTNGLVILTTKGKVYPSAIRHIMKANGEDRDAFTTRILETIIQPGFVDNFPRQSFKRGRLRDYEGSNSK